MKLKKDEGRQGCPQASILVFVDVFDSTLASTTNTRLLALHPPHHSKNKTLNSRLLCSRPPLRGAGCPCPSSPFGVAPGEDLRRAARGGRPPLRRRRAQRALRVLPAPGGAARDHVLPGRGGRGGGGGAVAEGGGGVEGVGFGGWLGGEMWTRIGWCTSPEMPGP